MESNVETSTRGNSSSRASTALDRGAWSPETDRGAPSKTAGKTAKGADSLGSRTNCLFLTSIRSPTAEKKSDPKIGRGTSASRKVCTTLRDLKRSDKRFVPNVLIAEPFAATNDPDAEEDAVLGVDWEDADKGKDTGNTETSAPLSTRKRRPESSSLMDMAPRPAEMVEME